MRPNVFAVAILVILESAAAALQPGPYNPRPTGDVAQITGVGESAARRVLHKFGKCIVSRNRRGVMAYVTTNFDDPSYRKRLENLAMPACLGGGGLRIPPQSLRGAIFEGLYQADLLAASGAFDPEIKSGFADLQKGATSPDAQNRIALEQFGECVARANPDEVRNLLRSEPTSSEEASSMQRLAPLFGGCIRKGQVVTFSKTILRGAVAEGLYWLSRGGLPAGA